MRACLGTVKIPFLVKKYIYLDGFVFFEVPIVTTNFIYVHDICLVHHLNFSGIFIAPDLIVAVLSGHCGANVSYYLTGVDSEVIFEFGLVRRPIIKIFVFQRRATYIFRMVKLCVRGWV
jgi:hypothetical protein